MSDDGKSSVPSAALVWRRVALVALWALVPSFGQSALARTLTPVTLQVEAPHGLPGLHHSALARFIAAHMAEAGLADWRFEPAADKAIAADRVEWTFRLNPYAGGEVRNFAHTPTDQWRFGVHRPVTIEARLYLNGEYQTLVEKQAIIQGGADDPDLGAAVASVTQNLLGPSGAYRAINTGEQGGYHSR
jgi:hypothetical protein